MLLHSVAVFRYCFHTVYLCEVLVVLKQIYLELVNYLGYSLKG